MKPAISPKPREKNGRPQRPTKAQIEAAQRALEEREKSVVLAQPHRRGNTDQKCGWPLGEFAIANKARIGWDEALYDAGNEYSSIVRRWRLAKGLPDPSAGRGVGVGSEADPDYIAKLESRWNEAEDFVRYKGGIKPYLAIRSLCADHETLPDAEHGHAMHGLRLLARHFLML